jgi:hypothetical protein
MADMKYKIPSPITPAERAYKLRFWIVKMLWKLPFIRHRYCWLSADMWAFYGTKIERSDQCGYCGACEDDA